MFNFQGQVSSGSSVVLRRGDHIKKTGSFLLKVNDNTRGISKNRSNKKESQESKENDMIWASKSFKTLSSMMPEHLVVPSKLMPDLRASVYDRQRGNQSAEPARHRESIDYHQIKLINLEDEPDDEVSQFFAKSDVSCGSQTSPRSSLIVTEDHNYQFADKPFHINLAPFIAEQNWRASNP